MLKSLLAGALVLLASSAHGQTYGDIVPEGQQQQPLNFCIEEEVITEIANVPIEQKRRALWFKHINDGDCGQFTIPWFYYRTLAIIGTNRIAEMKVKTDEGWESVYSLWFDPPPYLHLIQHNHDEGHNDYKDWSSLKTGDCCNNQDCGDLNEDEVRETTAGTEVLVRGHDKPDQWCPVKKEHFLTRGQSPDWQKAHACIINTGFYADTCNRLLCFTPKGGW